MIEAPTSSAVSISPQPSSINASPMIAVRSLVKRIGQQEILRGVDLEVARGQTLARFRSEEHTSELQSHHDLVCRLLLEKKKSRRACALDSEPVIHCGRDKGNDRT